ncbi:OmpW/AlkL family protein [Xanthobacter sp. AM11]|uniref:OmpW/AlkL family protein n=1 Tax=Xanthobacter sp. AM11 TaxID=3380643 RepID=UPI0039BEEEC5
MTSTANYGWRSALAGAAAGMAAALALPACGQAADLAAAPAAAPAMPDPAWYVRVGLGGVLFDSGATITTPLGTVAGASAHAENNLTALVEVGYFLYDNIAISLTGGYPPTTTLSGTGTATALGTLGKVTYGPATLTAHYHFKDFGPIQPYVGAGVGYSIIFNSTSGAVQNLSVRGAPAFVLQAGVDYILARNWAVFFDVKKLFLSVDATGTLGGVPVSADVKLDPLVLFTGITYRF